MGVVKSYDEETKIATIEQRNKAFEGEEAQVLRPVGDYFKIKLNDIRNLEGKKIESTPVAQMIYTISSDVKLEKNDMLIVKK